MEAITNIFGGTDELEESNGVPLKTKANVSRFCKGVSEFAINYVNEPTVGLYFIQNHLHDKLGPRNEEVKLQLLQTLQESREVMLELDGVSRYLPTISAVPESAGEKNELPIVLDDMLHMAREMNDVAEEIANRRLERKTVNKTMEAMLDESPVTKSLGARLSEVMGPKRSSTSGGQAGDFDAWYKSQFKA